MFTLLTINLNQALQWNQKQEEKFCPIKEVQESWQRESIDSRDRPETDLRQTLERKIIQCFGQTCVRHTVRQALWHLELIMEQKNSKNLLFGRNLKDANDLLCSTGICLSQSPASEHPNLQWTMCIKKNNTNVFKGCLIGLKRICRIQHDGLDRVLTQGINGTFPI